MSDSIITIEVDLVECPAQLHTAIEVALEKCGSPICWIVSDIDAERQKVLIDAVLDPESELADEPAFS